MSAQAPSWKEGMEVSGNTDDHRGTPLGGKVVFCYIHNHQTWNKIQGTGTGFSNVIGLIMAVTSPQYSVWQQEEVSGEWYANRTSTESTDEINIWVTPASLAVVLCVINTIARSCSWFPCSARHLKHWKNSVYFTRVNLSSMETLWASCSPHVYFHFTPTHTLCCLVQKMK